MNKKREDRATFKRILLNELAGHYGVHRNWMSRLAEGVDLRSLKGCIELIVKMEMRKREKAWT